MMSTVEILPRAPRLVKPPRTCATPFLPETCISILSGLARASRLTSSSLHSSSSLAHRSYLHRALLNGVGGRDSLTA